MNQTIHNKTPEQMVEAIFALDFEQIKSKLMNKKEGHGWTRAQADRYEQEYKRFLALQAKYPDESIAPNVNVDKFWHGHILDTMKYAKDCEQIFGYFLHHYPYFGLRGEQDAANQAAAAINMRRLYQQEFGAQAKPGDIAYCGRASDKANAEQATYCGRAAEPAIDAAYCGRAAGQAQEAAYCGKSAGPAQDAAYCGKASASYCGAAAGEQTMRAQAEDAAYCGRAASEAGPAAQDAAYCGRASASYCGAAVAQADAAREQETAYCGRAAVDAGQEAAYCGRASASYCGAAATSK